MTERLTVIYNDTCPICSREVASYRREAEAAGLPLSFEGLASPERIQAGLTEDAAARRFHVVRDDEIISGVDAFAILWDRLPRWRWLARIVRLPVIHGLARAAYDRLAAPALFALHRRRQARGTP
jgi:predicted DCC family thiol-disulfide oxidoreductase YuxK